MDNFTPADCGLLSNDTYAWLADLLNLIEEGAPWPKDLCIGKAAYPSKDANNT